MLVLQLRAGLCETRHEVSAVAVSATGGPTADPCWRTGPETESTWRSAAKPLQLQACLDALGDPSSLRDVDLAIAASSHSGQGPHVAAVRHLLARFGVDEAELRCGAEPPVHRPTLAALLAAGEQPRPIHNDCSGKHAMMLAACHARGWPVDDYRDPDHPLQRRIIDLAHRWCGQVPGVATDGCGVPTLWLSLTGMARAWARIAAAMADAAVDPTLHRIGRAMAAHPWWTSGDDRLDLALARRVVGPLPDHYVGKIGARGLFCVALPSRRLGVAIKVADGDEDALAVAVPAVLEAIAPGTLAPAPRWPWATIRDVIGRPVGHRLVRDDDGA